ncbi:MAG: hypothetical protein WCK35_04060 [Chloroflexota bacterium]
MGNQNDNAGGIFCVFLMQNYHLHLLNLVGLTDYSIRNDNDGQLSWRRACSAQLQGGDLLDGFEIATLAWLKIIF